MTIIVLFCLTVFAFEPSEIEKSWRDKGYTILEKDPFKIVELSFQFDNDLSLNESAREFYVITYLNQETTAPVESYISDVEKALVNSSFSRTVVENISEQLKSQKNWENTFFATDTLQVKTLLYDQQTPVLKMIFLEKKEPQQESVTNEDVTYSKFLEEQLEAFKAENSQLEAKNKQLKLEKEILINQTAVLEYSNQNLKEDLEKFKNLSQFKDRTISGLKSTIDHYVGIEKQKNETIETLEMKIQQLEAEYLEEKANLQTAIQDLETQIETLEYTVKRQILEIEMMAGSQQQLLARMEQLKTDHEKSIKQFQQPISHEQTKIATASTTIVVTTPTHVQESLEATDAKTTTIITTPTQQKTKKVPSEKEEVKGTPEEEEEEEVVVVVEKAEETEKEDLKEKTQESNANKHTLPVLKQVIVYNEGEKAYIVNHDYNDAGELVKERILSPEGQTLLITEIKYNSNGRVKERISYERSKMVGKDQFQYDEQQRLKRVFSYNQESLTHYSVMEYDESLSQTDPVRVKYYRNNELDSLEENEFAKDGRIIQTTRKNASDLVLSRQIFEYKDGKPVKIILERSGKKAGYQVIRYNKKGLQESQKTYDEKDQVVSEMKFIWGEGQ